MSLPEQYLAIDEEGYPLLGELRVQDAAVGAQILSTLSVAENGAFVCQVGTQEAFVEAFDEPLIAQMVEAPSEKGGVWTALFLYGVKQTFSLKSLSVDEWDRFHGFCSNQIPFVLSRKAQTELFNRLDEFDDDSITYQGEKIPVHPWLSSDTDIRHEKYWSDIYRSQSEGWELNQPAPALKEMLPRIKLPKSRVLVLGCGSGNDAAFFAEHGHVVTGVDFSPEAIAKAKSKYGSLPNLNFVEKDVFLLDPNWNQSFDLIFEHTCYCAIPPERRNELVKVWRRLLAPTGQLMGVFFTMERRSGPPFGGSEWELRERLKPYFHFTFWGRWRQSIQRRNGKELFILASKKEL